MLRQYALLLVGTVPSAGLSTSKICTIVAWCEPHQCPMPRGPGRRHPACLIIVTMPALLPAWDGVMRCKAPGADLGLRTLLLATSCIGVLSGWVGGWAWGDTPLLAHLRLDGRSGLWPAGPAFRARFRARRHQQCCGTRQNGFACDGASRSSGGALDCHPVLLRCSGLSGPVLLHTQHWHTLPTHLSTVPRILTLTPLCHRRSAAKQRSLHSPCNSCSTQLA